MLKRIFDFCLAVFGLTVSLPFWAMFIFLIIIDSGLPVFYYQERVGISGMIFKGIKFRSMRQGAEDGLGPVQAKEHDSRVTVLGRIMRVTAMDELPQLINIAKGDMSFVGPRALRPTEADAGSSLPISVWDIPGFSQRCSVRPGLTGVAQVFADRDIPRQEKFKYDIWYVKNRSLKLDLALILASFLITFMGKWEVRGCKIRGYEFKG